MKCRRCGLENPVDAERCDCGYDFTSNTQEDSYLPESTQKPSPTLLLFTLLFAFLGGGVGIILSYSIAYGRTAGSAYRYDPKSRLLGRKILIFSIVMTTIYLASSLLQAFA